MRRRIFGSSGIAIPVIGQGTWNVPTRGVERDDAIAAIRTGISLGMTHIDTAEMYGDGAAEELVGAAIADVARDELFLVSKVLPPNATYAGTIAACERSLRRLGTSYLDCYLLHWRGEVPLEETMHALEDLVAAGKTRSLGVSNFDADDLREAQAALRRERIACNQVLYHLGERTIETVEIPVCREADIALVGYTPFGRNDWSDAPGASLLHAIAGDHGVSAHAVILAFLTRDEICFTIPKAAHRAHVIANAAAGDLVLDAAEIAAIEAAFPRGRRRGGLPTL
jgi:diketogulonate reductase-like aldo/keto reductase